MAMIEGLTHLGLGKVDDGRTLLPRVLPGEEIEVAQDGGVRIITPSADRVAAPCRHFKTCGGCAMQHATDAFVENWKLEIVQKALTAQRIDTTYRDVLTSPANSRRRAKIAGKRTKSGAMLGFHAKGTHNLIATPDCQLLTPGIIDAFPVLEKLVVIAASRKAEIALTVTETLAGLDIFVDTETPLTPELRQTLASFAQDHKIARIVWPDEPVVTMNPPQQFFGNTRVTPPSGAFLQATKHGEASLLGAVDEITAGAKRIVDLFAGCGTFTLPLSARAEIHAVEGEAEMIAALDRGWREGRELKRVTSEVRDLFRRPLEPDELRKFDAAVIDPPRAGAEAQIATVCASDINTIAMVSCNPATFARDAVQLEKAGFTLHWVQVVDQFRWSPHVEVVGNFTRK